MIRTTREQVFADTSGLGQLLDPTQPFHGLTFTIYHDLRARGGRLVTTNYVISELVALLTSPLRV